MKDKIWYILLTCSLCLMSGSCQKKTPGEFPSQEASMIERLESSADNDYRLLIHRLDSLLPSVGDSTWYCRGLILKSRGLMFMAQNDSALDLLQQVKQHCERMDTNLVSCRSLYARMYNMRGNILCRISLMDSARNEFLRAYKWCMMTPDKNELLGICMNLADAYVREGRFDKGSFWYRRALAYSDSLKLSDIQRFPIYYGLAQVNMELHDFQRCDDYYNLAGKFYDQMQVYEKHVYLNNRGNSYYFRQDYRKALGYFLRADSLLENYPNMEFERNLTYVNLGEVYLLLNRTDSAAYYLDKCQRFFKRNHNNSALYYIDTQLIELALVKGDIALARRRLKEAVRPDFIEPNMVHSRNRYLQHYFEKVGNFKKAYEFQMYNNRIDDSIRNERVRMRASEIALQYQQDSTLLSKELLIKQQQNHMLRLNQWIYMSAGLGLLLVAGGVIGILYWKRKRDRLEWGMKTDIISLKLKNVRNCISPHFIFNVLNQAILSKNEGEEEKKLMNLVKLIRYSLVLTDNLTVTLHDELDFVRTYVALQGQTLLPDFKFDVKIDSEVNPESFSIPAMLLQIPVENAVKHALKTKDGKKCLWIDVNKTEVAMVLKVRDNGGGFVRSTATHGTGTGLKVIMQTIQLLNLYNRHPIEMRIHDVISEEGEKGCEVYFSIPLDYSYELKNRKEDSNGKSV